MLSDPKAAVQVRVKAKRDFVEQRARAEARQQAEMDAERTRQARYGQAGHHARFAQGHAFLNGASTALWTLALPSAMFPGQCDTKAMHVRFAQGHASLNSVLPGLCTPLVSQGRWLCRDPAICLGLCMHAARQAGSEALWAPRPVHQGSVTCSGCGRTALCRCGLSGALPSDRRAVPSPMCLLCAAVLARQLPFSVCGLPTCCARGCEAPAAAGSQALRDALGYYAVLGLGWLAGQAGCLLCGVLFPCRWPAYLRACCGCCRQPGAA